MNHDHAEDRVPVNADVRESEVILVEEHDEVVYSLGSKGLGENGIVGVAAAITNAISHATGRRARSLPITPDMLPRAGPGPDSPGGRTRRSRHERRRAGMVDGLDGRSRMEYSRIGACPAFVGRLRQWGDSRDPANWRR